MKKLFFLLSGLILLSGCSLFASAPGDLSLTKADSGKTLTLSTNQTITLTLDSNATTAYKWNLVTQPDAQVLKLVSSRYNPPGQQIPGAGGTETWVFQAVGAGSASFKLGYFRPFEPQNVGGEFTLTVMVR